MQKKYMMLLNTQLKTRFFKKIFPIGAGVGLSIAAVSTLVSCGTNIEVDPTKNEQSSNQQLNKTFDKTYDFAKINWSDFKLAEEVTVVSWIDGDTLTIKKADGTQKNLRISFIDTPETHVSNAGSWSDTNGLEHQYGIKALEYGKSEMPKGSKIKVDFEAGESYNRLVGSVFYGNNFAQNYETNIVKKGLALPFVSNVDYLHIKQPSSMLHYLGKPIADAYNYALQNKQGLFERDLNDVLKVHGTTNLDSVKHDTKSTKSIYHYIDVDAWED